MSLGGIPPSEDATPRKEPSLASSPTSLSMYIVGYHCFTRMTPPSSSDTSKKDLLLLTRNTHGDVFGLIPAAMVDPIAAQNAGEMSRPNGTIHGSGMPAAARTVACSV